MFGLMNYRQILGFIPYGSTESTERRCTAWVTKTQIMVSSHTARPRALKEKRGHGRPDAIPISSHTARPRALKGMFGLMNYRQILGFIPYGSTESTESGIIIFIDEAARLVSSHTARPRALKVAEVPHAAGSSARFHPIRLDREH